MKTLNELIVEKTENNKYYAIMDRNDIMYNFYYTKDEANDELKSLLQDTPSMKYRIETINKSDIEK